MVYFSPAMDMSREMSDGRKWFRVELCVVDFQKVMEDRANGRSKSARQGAVIISTFFTSVFLFRLMRAM